MSSIGSCVSSSIKCECWSEGTFAKPGPAAASNLPAPA